MYQEQAPAINGAKSENQVFKSIYERLEKQNSWQYEALLRVEDKLHQLLNRRSPEKEPGKSNPEIGDLAQALGRQLDIMQSNCERLETINRHLDMIL